MKKAFTLIELLMVIALIAIVSTLAVSKLGGVREVSARKVSLANQKAVERAVEAYLVNGGRLNRLDSLLYAGDGGAPLTGGTEGDFDFTAVSTAESRNGLYLGPSDDESARIEQNSGITPDLQKILCLYTLNRAQAEALNTRLGLRHVMAATAYAAAAQPALPSLHYHTGRAYGDGTVPNASDGLDPNASFCVATLVTNSMRFVAINPMTDLGRTVFGGGGEFLLNATGAAEIYTESEVRAEVAAKGGPLLAFGLGDAASIIGKSDAGLEDAPYATFVQKRYYSRYILLFRLKTIGAGSVSQVIPEFAGVIDCEGNTVRAAQHVIKRM